LFWEPQLPWDVLADTGFLWDKTAVIGTTTEVTCDFCLHFLNLPADELVEITNKMQPCNRIYYSKVY